ILAVEPTPGLAETCRRKGITILEQTVESLDRQAISADFVASFEVIEHLFSPYEYLRICRDLLKPGGLLLVTCPSCKGFDVMTLGAASTTYDAEHLNYFHPDSLSLLVKKCGFEVLETSTPGRLDADIVRSRVLKGELNLHEQPFLQHVLVTEWETKGQIFQDFLSNNNLSSHLWLLARHSTD
ncbi:MAG: class I SAM-dependent methyltransferase, partial [Terrimicrobiaceae bacterium]